MSNDPIGDQPRPELPSRRSSDRTTDHGHRLHRRRLAFLVPVLGLALLAGCGDGDGRSPTPTSSPTTAVAPSPSVSRGSTTSGVKTTAAERPTPSGPAAASLTNGTHPVYLTAVDTGRRTITVDLVQLLDRNSAEAANVCPELAGGDGDGYCIKNESGQLRTVAVPSSASIRVLRGSDLRKVDLSGLAAARRSQKEESFYEVTVSGGKVTSVKELYRP